MTHGSISLGVGPTATLRGVRIDPETPLVPDPAGPAIVVGLMSGTSADGVDAAVCRLVHPGGGRLDWKVLGTASIPYEHDLAEALRAPRALDVPRLAACHARVGAVFSRAAHAALEAAGLAPGDVTLVGSHGQTVWHDPHGIHGGHPVTFQIGDAARIAAGLSCPVWYDFRSADLAVGGEGAPLVPYVDWLLFADPETWRVCLNLGGIANVTLLPPGVPLEEVIAFDTGPANVVLDRLARRLLETSHDAGGARAAAGRVDEERAEAALADPFFALPAPKSTGPEWFNDEWVVRYFGPLADLEADEVDGRLATAARVTVESVARALEGQAATPVVPDDAEILVAGGGRKNQALMDGLARRLAPRTVVPVDERGVDGDHKEALAFAILAYEGALGRPANVPRATGAARPARLGAVTFPPPARGAP